MSKIYVKDIDLNRLDELANDDYFYPKERVLKGQKATEDVRDDGKHKKQSQRKFKTQ
jgi:hypothetical protein